MVGNRIGDGGVPVQGDDAQIEDRGRTGAYVDRMPEITRGLAERPIVAENDLDDREWHDN